jgi:hypothetical protein
VDIVTLAQVITSVTNLLFVIVLAAGYYFTWRVSQTTLEEMRAQRTAMGRPLIIVQEDYESLPELDVAIRNVSEGAARDIEFEFSVPIESSNGFVVSDLPYLLQIRARLSAAERRDHLLLGRTRFSVAVPGVEESPERHSRNRQIQRPHR